ncbi:MAG: PKD domain-containing protein [Acidobacteriota bacterium]
MIKKSINLKFWYRLATGLAVSLVVLGTLQAWRIASAKMFQDIDQPLIGSGIPQVGSNSPQSALSNLKAGSLLIFPKYASSSASPARVNTIISLTNTNPRDGVIVRLAWIHDCQVDNTFVTLAGNQTQSLLASLENPGQSGYLMAIAVNSNGIPTQFNWLIVSATLRSDEGFTASYNAVGIAKRTAGAVQSASTTEVPVIFNDVQYDRLPELVALDHLPNQDSSAGEALRTDLNLISPVSSLTGGVAEPMKVTAVAYDQSGRPFPQTTDGSCAMSKRAADFWTDPALATIISPQRPGWARFAAANGNRALPLLGLRLTNEPAAGLGNARHMQVIRRLETFTMAVPIISPGATVPDSLTGSQPLAEGKSLGAGEMKPGSILIFPRFTSGTQGSSRLYLTNTHATAKARIRIIFNGTFGNGAVAETIISLFPNQTTVVDPQEFIPNQKGWVMAIAIDLRALPLNFNNLIGSSQVTEQSGARNGYAALAIAKNSTGAVPRNTDIQTSDIIFNDRDYDRLPATLSYNGIPSQVDNITTIGYSRFSTDVTAIPNLRGLIQVTLIDPAIKQSAGVLSLLETRVSTINITSTSPPVPITQTLLSGHRGWLKLSPSTPTLSWANNVATAPFSSPGIFADYEGGLSGYTTPHILTTFGTFTTRTMALNPNNTGPTADFEVIEPVIEARARLGTIVRLDGRVSTDPDPEDPLTYRWFDNDVEISTAKVSDYRLSKGTHTINLIVADGNGTTSEPKTQQVEVVDTTAPVLSGIPSNISRTISSSVGTSINFNLPIAYDAVDGWLSVTANPRPNSLFKVGRTVVTFAAKDSSGNVTTASMTVTINTGGNFPISGGVVGNKSPYLNNLNDQHLLVGKVRTYVLQAEDPNNDTVTFELAGAPAFARIERANPVLRRANLVMAPVEGSQIFASNVRVIARDSRGTTYSTLPFRIVLSDLENDETGSGVGPGTGGGDGGDGGGGGGGDNPPPANQSPTAVAAKLAASVKATTRNGAIVTLDGSGSSDPEKDPLTYVWKNGDKVIAEGAIVEATLAVGTHSITLTVTDTVGGTSTTAAQSIVVLPRDLTVTGINPVRIPLFNSVNMTITGTGFNSGTTAQFECTSVCSGGSRITVTIVSIEEDTMVINARTTLATPMGNRNLIVTNPGGATVRIMRSNFVTN